MTHENIRKWLEDITGRLTPHPVAKDVEKLLQECEETKGFLSDVRNVNYEAFLYENRDSTNVPGSKDQPRNAYNATKTLADRADYLLKKWKAE